VTREHRIIAGLDDIKAVTLECRHCRTRVSLAPDNIRAVHQFPKQCPHCNQQWVGEIAESTTAPKSPYLRLCSAVASIRERGADAPFRILLEFEAES
jgi:hypothetical protein